MLKELPTQFHLIPPDRKEKLEQLSAYLSGKFSAGQIPSVIVICTHNSRRSHLGQLWLSIAADHYGLPRVDTYSGGTEATALAPPIVEALKDIGLQVRTEATNPDNPVYYFKWKEDMQPLAAFSKAYGDAPNPRQDFAAIMVCDSADQACPTVSGADFRLALPFQDPKRSDGTPEQSAVYAASVREIGREMMYVASRVKSR